MILTSRRSMWWRWRVHDWLFVFVLFSRKTTSAYQRAARWTWGSLERKRMSTQRWLKRRWTLTTVSQIVSTHTDTHTIKDKCLNLKDDFDWLLLCIWACVFCPWDGLAACPWMPPCFSKLMDRWKSNTAKNNFLNLPIHRFFLSLSAFIHYL